MTPTVGMPTARLDVLAHAHAPVDFTIDVLDALGPVSSLAGWSVSAKAAPAGSDPVVLTATIVGTKVRVVASAAQTAAWFDGWRDRAAPWDVVLTTPQNVPLEPLCAGWWRIEPTHSR